MRGGERKLREKTGGTRGAGSWTIVGLIQSDAE